MTCSAATDPPIPKAWGGIRNYQDFGKTHIFPQIMDHWVDREAHF